MKSAWSVVLIVALVLAALAGWDMYRSSRRDLAEYRVRVASVEADNALHQAAILKAESVITQKDAEIAQYVDKIQTYHAEIASLSSRLDALQDAEPPTTPEVESLPIVVNLRGQVARLTEMFTLSQSENAAKDRLIVSKDTIITAQAEAMAALTAQRDNYKALWQAADGLASKSRRVTLKEKLTWAVVGAGAGVLAHSILDRR